MARKKKSKMRANVPGHKTSHSHGAKMSGAVPKKPSAAAFRSRMAALDEGMTNPKGARKGGSKAREKRLANVPM